MTFLESLTKSGVGFLIVFIGLAMLIALVTVMGKICGKLLSTKAPASKTTEQAVAAAVPASKEIANREELVAVLSAAVAEELGTDVSAIRVVSLKQIG